MDQLVSLNLRYSHPPPTPGDIAVQKAATELDMSHKKQTLTEWLSCTGIVGDSDGLGANPTANRLLQNYQDWVYACVSTISGRMADLPHYLKLRRKMAKTTEELDIEDHVLFDLLDDPNPVTTGRELMWITAADAELTGHSYWWMEPDQRAKVPVRIWRLPPDPTVIYDNSGRYALRYLFTSNGAFFDLPPEEVVHFRLPGGVTTDIGDSFHGGFSPLQASARAMDLNLFSQIYEANFYRNNAVPPMVVVFPPGVKHDDAWIKAFNDQWNSRHMGLDNAHKVAILGGGADIKMLAIPNTDRRFIEVSQMTRDKILGCYKVPAAKIGLTTDSNRSNSESADYTFNRECIAPLASLFAATINKYICKRYYQYGKAARLVFYFDNPVPKDEERELKRLQTMVEMGWITPSEAALELGYEAFDGGDQRLVKTGLMLYDNLPVAGIGPAFPPDLSGKAARGSLDKSLGSGRKYAHCKTLELWKEAAADMKKAGGISYELHLELYSRHLKAMKAPMKKFKAALKSAFEAQRDRVLANLQEAYPKAAGRIDRSKSPEAIAKFVRKAIAVDDFFNDEAEAKVFYSLMQPFLSETFLDALGAVMMELTGEQRRKLTQRAVDWLNAVTRRYADAITEASSDKIKDLVRAAMIDGTPVTDLADQIGALYDGWTDYRVEAIARTELNSAKNGGTHEGMKETGLIAQKQWISALDERTRRPPASDFDHWAAHNSIANIDEPFTATGGELMFPGDPNGEPGDTINCRCVEIAVIAGEEE